MTVLISFVHFPKSNEIKSLVEDRILKTLEKYTDRVNSVKAFFSPEGEKVHVKFLIRGDNYGETVESTDKDIPHTLEKVFGKFENFLRKISSKRKSKKHFLKSVPTNTELDAVNLRVHKRKYSSKIYNEFDKFESQFMNEFEESFYKKSY